MRKLLVCLLVISYGCNHHFYKSTTESNCGQITNSISFFDAESGTFIEDVIIGGKQIFFKDSLIIQPISEVRITEVNNEKSAKKHIFQYTFLDLKTRSFYDYSSNSDTAFLLKKYSLPDSVQGVIWNFYDNKYLEEIDKSRPLSDTSIGEKIYKRFTWQEINSIKKDTLTRIAYLDCNRKTMFQYFKNFSEKVGCPVVMIEQRGLLPRKYLMKYEIKFEADTLTPYQHKVFDAWEKYAKKHPVK